MAVYTDIDEEALKSWLSAYDVGALLSYRGIAEGVENSNFLVHTTKGQFILTLYEKRVKRDDLPFFLQLMHHLAIKGIFCPQAVMRRDGELIADLAGRPAALITFLEGIWMRHPAPSHCAQLGETLAKFHLAGQDFSLKRPNTLSLVGWRQLWQKIGADADKIEPITMGNLSQEIARELDFLEQHWPVRAFLEKVDTGLSQKNATKQKIRAVDCVNQNKKRSNLPEGIIHADLFPDNVFFIGEELSGLIDFYFACNDWFAYDLAICLNAWGFEADFSYNITKASALLSSYHKIRPLEEAERYYLPLLARGAAMRFFLTRAYDWFHTPQTGLVVKKDPAEYVAKLRFFQHIEQAFELGLPS